MKGNYQKAVKIGCSIRRIESLQKQLRKETRYLHRLLEQAATDIGIDSKELDGEISVQSGGLPK